MALPVNRSVSEGALTVDMTDVSTASEVWVASPWRGKIRRVYAVLGAAITVANSAITVEINGTANAALAFTIVQSGSAAGSVFSVETNTDVVVNEGDAISIVSDGGSTTTARTTFTILIDRD